MNFFRVRKLFFSVFAIYPWLVARHPWGLGLHGNKHIKVYLNDRAQ